MNEFWDAFWNSFWKICQLELRNVSVTNFIIFTLIVAGFVHIGCLIYVRVKKHSIYLSTEIMIVLLISYTYFIAQVTLLSRGLEDQARVFDTKWLWLDRSMDQNMTNLLNIFLFLPFGTLITGIEMNKYGIKRFILVINYCFLTSLLIECTQYITKRGYFEIDDIEANIVGGLAGSIFFSLCLKIGRLITKKNTEVNNEKETQTGHL
jgi:glycopeptide antibiotics resistance protein